MVNRIDCDTNRPSRTELNGIIVHLQKHDEQTKIEFNQAEL